ALEKDDIVNIFMDYETFGEHQNVSTGIFDFLKHLPGEIMKYKTIQFDTPSEICKKHQPVAPLHVPFPISWADEERDTSAWIGNELQNEAFAKLYSAESKVKNSGDTALLSDFRKLQESDHFYYMCTKFFSDGAVHKYFNPYETPYEAFINYMNVVSDFLLRCDRSVKITGQSGGTIIAEEKSPVKKKIVKKVKP
ncbi:MAG TPA: alpha-amylase, partial [Rikenellaceae bacterium]|nr:alpha-amylase [Rikenellaceae bacterium]